MGFVFRSVFWLGIAMVALPPEARLGGGNGDTAEFRDVDIAEGIKTATATLWAAGDNLMNTCQTNPQLCKAGADLVNTSLAAAANAADGIARQLRSPSETSLATAEETNQKNKKILARVE